MVKCNGVMYTYVHNLQGDIVAILDNTGAKVLEYKYDAWGKPVPIEGNHQPSTLELLNPFRYRGYVYDEETGLYYLRSRYYSAERYRFINSVIYIGEVDVILAHNVFVYCSNAPISLLDADGYSFLDYFLYRLKYNTQYKFWSDVAVMLSAFQFHFSGELLLHSLQPHPKDKYYSPDSALAKKIKKDRQFQKKAQEIISSGRFNENCNDVFEDVYDLFGAIHQASVIITPIVIDGKNLYRATIHDTYNFEHIKSYSISSPELWKRIMKYGAIEGNNLAVDDIKTGAINEYEIYIDFYLEE